MFEMLGAMIREEVVLTLFHVEVQREEPAPAPAGAGAAAPELRARVDPRRRRDRCRRRRCGDRARRPPNPFAPQPQVVNEHRDVGRNDPCWCGSRQEVQELPRRLDACAAVGASSRDVARIEPFRPELRHEFRRALGANDAAGAVACLVGADWDGWGERSRTRTQPAESLATVWLLAFDGDRPVGWCQVGPRDRLAKLVAQLELEPDPSVWAVTCFVVSPSHRRRGVVAALLEAAVSAARAAGASRLEGYPRVVADEPGEMWTGPIGLYRSAGFDLAREGSPRSVLSLQLRR